MCLCACACCKVVISLPPLLPMVKKEKEKQKPCHSGFKVGFVKTMYNGTSSGHPEIGHTCMSMS